MKSPREMAWNGKGVSITPENLQMSCNKWFATHESVTHLALRHALMAGKLHSHQGTTPNLPCHHCVLPQAAHHLHDRMCSVLPLSCSGRFTLRSGPAGSGTGRQVSPASQCCTRRSPVASWAASRARRSAVAG